MNLESFRKRTTSLYVCLEPEGNPKEMNWSYVKKGVLRTPSWKKNFRAYGFYSGV